MLQMFLSRIFIYCTTVCQKNLFLEIFHFIVGIQIDLKFIDRYFSLLFQFLFKKRIFALGEGY